MTIAFDTLKFVDRLVAGGFTDAQAKAAASAFSEAMTDSAVTRSDLVHATDRVDAKIDALGARLDARIDALEAKVDARIDALEAKVDARIDALEAKVDARFDASEARSDTLELRLTVKMGAMFVVAIGVIAALVKLLH